MNSSAVAERQGMPTIVRSISKLGSSANILSSAYVILCVLSILPFVLVTYPPIADFANHAARLNIACNRADPLVAAVYRYGLGVIPNLAVDLANVPACGIFDSVSVLKIVTSGSLLLIYASGWLVQRRLFGRPNGFLFLLPAIAFNLVTTMGYINYLAGVAVTCLMVALAIGNENRPRFLFLLCNIGGLVVFFCHIFALAVAILFFFGLMLRASGFTPKSVVLAGLRTIALFALPLALLALIPRESHSLVASYALKPRIFIALFSAPHANIGVSRVALLALLYPLSRYRLVRLDPWFQTPLAVLALYILLVPNWIGQAFDIDTRSVVALGYLGFAPFRPIKREFELNAGLGFLAAGAVAFQLWATATIWLPFSREVEEFRAADVVLPAHAKVLSVFGDDDGGGPAQAAYAHLTSYATIDRRIFNPLEFTGIGMQPLALSASLAGFRCR